MKKRSKRPLFVGLCVVAVIVVAGVVSVRLFLTRERLLAILIPRVEKAVNAKVEIGDVGVRFPFGFGVDIDKLSFEKELPGATSFVFSSDKVTVRASLMSLIRKKPEIKAADVSGGAVTISNRQMQRELKIRGLRSHLSMQPVGEGFAVRAKALVDSTLVAVLGRPPALTLEKVGFDGTIEGDRELARLAVKDSRISWEDLFAAKVTGEVTNVKTAPRIELTVEGEEKPIAPIMERVKSFKLEELAPAKQGAAGGATPKAPIELSKGTLRFAATLKGLVKEPLGMTVSFELSCKDVAAKAGELGSIGRVNANLKGEGAVLALQRLFPSGTKPTTPAEIQVAWQAVRLDGKIEVSDGDLCIEHASSSSAAAGAPGGSDAEMKAAQAPCIRLSKLKANAEISGPDVKSFSGECLVGSSPFTFNGSMQNVMSAASELALVAKTLEEHASEKAPLDVGSILDRMVNVPVVRLEVAGRSFDARPYEKPLSGAGEAPQAAPKPRKAPGAAGGGEAASRSTAGAAVSGPSGSAGAAGAASAGGLLLLKNTTFTAKVDSIVAREALITGLEAKGTVRDGRVTIDPVSFVYAGGKGSAVVNCDLRTQPRIETKVDVSAQDVQAGEALGQLSPFGKLLDGRFTVKSNATVASGPGINPLMSLTAAGSALSNKGTVNIETFIQPLSTISGFDVTPFKQLDFSEWSGNFLVKNGRFISDNWKIDSSKGAWTIKGSFGFDGTLDYAVHVVIPPNVQSLMKGLDAYKAALDLMRDQSGNLVLDIHVGGNTKHPSASLDLTGARMKVQDKALENLRKRLLH